MDTEETLQGAPQQDTLFPDVDNSDAPKEEPKADERDEKITQLESMIEEGKAQNQRMEAMLQTSLSQKTTPPVSPQAETPAEAPDPITDPEGYQKHLADQTQRIVQQGNDAIRSENDRAHAYSNIWNEFTVKNPELAKDHIQLVKFNAAEALKEVADRGQDPQQYMMSNKDQFLSDIATRTNGMISKIKGNAEPNGRTEGIFPNSPRGKAGSEGSPQSKVSDFVSEMTEAQQGMGIF